MFQQEVSAAPHRQARSTAAWSCSCTMLDVGSAKKVLAGRAIGCVFKCPSPLTVCIAPRNIRSLVTKSRQCCEHEAMDYDWLSPSRRDSGIQESRANEVTVPTSHPF